jgi:hypothetical protein
MRDATGAIVEPTLNGDAPFTNLEKSVLRALIPSSAGNGHDFGFIEDARRCVEKKNQLAGVVSSLVQKGVIKVYEPVRTDSGLWTQFVFTAVEAATNRAELDAAVAALSAAAAGEAITRTIKLGTVKRVIDIDRARADAEGLEADAASERYRKLHGGDGW